MTQNTIIRGLTAGSGVLIERWGVQATVRLDPDSMTNLRMALYEKLPRVNKLSGRESVVDTVNYDHTIGAVRYTMTPEAARKLASEVRDPSLAALLRDAVDQHTQYTSSQGEPGIDKTVDEEQPP